MSNRYVLLVFRLAAAAVLIPVGVQKLVGGATDVQLFEILGMEPHGRVIIGFIEIGAGVLLLSPAAALGALLSISVMLGAVIAHTTVLGFDVGDGGKHVFLLIGVFLSSCVVLAARRSELPLVGKTLTSDPSSSP